MKHTISFGEKNCLRSMNIYRLIDHTQSCLPIYLSEKKNRSSRPMRLLRNNLQDRAYSEEANAYLGATARWGVRQLHRSRRWNGSDDFVHGLLATGPSSTLHMLRSYLVGLLDRIERKKGAHTNGRRGEDAPATVINHQTHLHT